MSESESLLTVRNVSNTYVTRGYGGFGKKEKKPVLDRISIEMKPGEIFGLVGESGCGKTTLGLSILGLIDHEGEIWIDGLRQDKRRRREMARKVQAVFQDPSSSLNPVKRIGWLLEEPLRIHRLGTRRERIRRVDEVLRLVGLDPSYKTRRIAELSGGQKQRVCIGCALMLEPKLIIADEAISALDVSVGAQILNLFRDLHERLGLALVFISHNLNLVYYLCDRIAVMYNGRIVELGTARAVYSAPAHPYTRTLLEAVPGIAGENPEPPGCALSDASGYAPGDTQEEPEPVLPPASKRREPAEGECCRFASRCRRRESRCGIAAPEPVNIAPPGEPPHEVWCVRPLAVSRWPSAADSE
ncbi:MAG: ATP-binding cassette domain-containing protein [Treponema sp.]|jgi:ABC-type glutathione transport system ATPase component|nr:ATP-binding cassette domain-containing protein [Treponema sp.]